MALAYEDGTNLYFSTSQEPSIFNDLQTNPYISATYMLDEQSWIRLKANIEFVDDVIVKEKINVFQI